MWKGRQPVPESGTRIRAVSGLVEYVNGAPDLLRELIQQVEDGLAVVR